MSQSQEEKAQGFNRGDNVVYPGHGLGEILEIETKEVMGTTLRFYVIRISETGMKISVPEKNVSSVGLRPLISKKEAGKVIDILLKKG